MARVVIAPASATAMQRPPQPPDTDKRQTALVLIRDKEYYRIVYYLIPHQLPPEPIPFALVSKRQWERQVMLWRVELRRLAATVDLVV